MSTNSSGGLKNKISQQAQQLKTITSQVSTNKRSDSSKALMKTPET